jgi:hypothetical protein
LHRHSQLSARAARCGEGCVESERIGPANTGLENNASRT